MSNPPTSDKSINEMCADITNGIYDACNKNRKRTTETVQMTHSCHENCTSSNFKAIAEANKQQYTRCSSNDDHTAAEHYRREWLAYHEIAIRKEEEELSDAKVKRWRYLVKNDTKKLWKYIDWKGCPKTKPEEIPQDTVHKFFKKIFQSDTLKDKPTIANIETDLQCYNQHSEVTDGDIDMVELKNAIKTMGTGCSFDGIAPDILPIIPDNLLGSILKLYRGIFDGTYPDHWQNQLLMPFPKKGHSVLNPKLRGVAIGPVLSRTFDIIMNNRFSQWYRPNPEQAGFRAGQGCLLQIFSLMILMDMAKILKRDLFVGLIDYEKAFDFVNRARLICDMMNCGIGSRFLKNFVNMYRNTNYITKTSNSRLGSEINTDHGVTQGKNSSANVFSFFISDMSDALVNLNTIDFMDPMSLLQLADDTSVLAEKIASFVKKMLSLMQYSDQKHQKVNNGKTKFLHMSDEPCMDDIQLDENISIGPVNPKEGYGWLGLWLTPTSDIGTIILFNYKKKINVTCKFYAWLEMNQDTPFKLKMKVLYGCMFPSLLYSCETWGDFECIKKDLLRTERKALKRCLGVKKGTTDDLIYFEVSRADIAATIQQRQYNFFQKINNLQEDEAVVKKLWNKYMQVLSSNNTTRPTLGSYYSSLNDNEVNTNITN